MSNYTSNYDARVSVSIIGVSAWFAEERNKSSDHFLYYIRALQNKQARVQSTRARVVCPRRAITAARREEGEEKEEEGKKKRKNENYSPVMTSAVESEPDLKFPAAGGARFTGPAWSTGNDVDDDSVRQSRTHARPYTYVHAHAHALALTHGGAARILT